MFSIWLAVSSQVEDKPFIDFSRSTDLLSVALSKSTFRSATLGGDAEICQLNKGGYKPESETQNKVFNCIRVNESKDMILQNCIYTLRPIKATEKGVPPANEL